MTKAQQQLAAYAFGVVFIVVLIVLAVRFPNPTPFQYTTFRIILALAAGGVAGMIPGFLNFEISNSLRAGGALAVFAIVYFKSPASAVAVTSGDSTATRQISIALRRAGADLDCPSLPQSAQLSVIPLQGTDTFPQLGIVEGCKATLIVPAKATGWVRLAITGAKPYELVKQQATYQLDADTWRVYVSDTPGTHLVAFLFSYTGNCSNLQNVLDTFQTILLTKAHSLRNLFSVEDHRYDYLSRVNVVATGQSLNMSTEEVRSYWEDHGALQVLSGLCFRRPNGEIMRSSIFSGPLAGMLPEPLVADLSVSETEFATSRDIYTAAMLYALAKEAQSRKLDRDIIINYLAHAREVASQIPNNAGVTLVAAIDGSLRSVGAPIVLPH